MSKNSSGASPGFEQAIARLEEIIRKTDSASTELEEVISMVEEGAKLIRHCKQILRKAELRIEILENPDEETDGDEVSNPQNGPNGTLPFSLN